MAIPAAKKYPKSTVETRRRATGWKLVGTANALTGNHKHLMSQVVEADKDWLDPKEAEAIAKLAKHLDRCEEQLRKLAKRMGVE